MPVNPTAANAPRGKAWPICAAVSVVVLMSMAATVRTVWGISPTPKLDRGDALGAFYVTKIAGAEHDGVAVNESLCYRCRYGSRPMVLLFARQTEGAVPKLVAAIDAAVRLRSDDQLRGLVTLLGDDTGKLESAARTLAERSEATQIPIVVAKQAVKGPENYDLPADADLVLIVASDSRVRFIETVSMDEIDPRQILERIRRELARVDTIASRS